MSLTPKARTALLASIKHYEENIALFDADKIDLISIEGSDCALCAEFFAADKGGNNCAKCPVFAYSATPGCQNTPWTDIRAAFQDFFDDKGPIENIRSALMAELEFLCSLLTD